MIPLKLDPICAYLKSKGIPAEHQPETGQLAVLFKIGEREYPLFIRIYDGEELLQLLAFLPCNTKPETRSDTARLLHLLNKEIDIPGFGMDEDSESVFYRCMVPIKEKAIDEKLLDSYINAINVICQSFAPVIAATAYGAATFEEIMKKTKEQSGQSLSKTQLGRG